MSLDQDDLEHVTIGDLDPTAAASMIEGYRACQLEWTDEIALALALRWCCTRRMGHAGQHLAGTGLWIVAVHPRQLRALGALAAG